MVELLDDAHEEMTAAAVWYEQRRPGLGDRFLHVAEATIRRIEDAPRAGSPMPLEGLPVPVRRQLIPGFPFAVVYVTEPELTVVAIAHTSRRPDYWRMRVARR